MTSKAVTTLLASKVNVGPYKESRLSDYFVRFQARMLLDDTVKKDFAEVRYHWKGDEVQYIEGIFEDGTKDFFGSVKLAARYDLRERFQLCTDMEEDAADYLPGYALLDMDEIGAP